MSLEVQEEWRGFEIEEHQVRLLSQLFDQQLRHGGFLGSQFNTPLVSFVGLHSLIADSLVSVKLVAGKLFRDEGLSEKSINAHSVFFLNLKTAEKEQDCLDAYVLAWNSYLVTSSVDAEEKLLLVAAVERGLATYELTEYAP